MDIHSQRLFDELRLLRKPNLMKKILLFICLLFNFQCSFAQLTNEQVYDFEVGDVFQVKFAGSVPGAPTETDTIIAKFYSSGMDTLFYVKSHFQYNPGYMQSPASYNYSIDTMAITYLTDPAQHYGYGSCLPPTDSVRVDNCGNSFIRLQSNHDSTCFEPIIWFSDLYYGLGGPYYYLNDGTALPALWYSKTLTYYNTQQHGECGTFQSYASINELNTFSIELAPNPVENALRIIVNNAEPLLDYAIYSSSGMLLSDGTITWASEEIDLSTLEKGYYFLQVRSGTEMSSLPFVKE